MINLTKTGAGNLIMIIIYSAMYYDDSEFFQSEFGQGMMSLLEEYTGLTYSILKKCVLKSKEGPITNLTSEELSTMSIPEIAKKYECSDSKVRHYIHKNNLEYKRVYKKCEQRAYVN